MESIRCAAPPLKGVVDVSASFDGVSFGASQFFACRAAACRDARRFWKMTSYSYEVLVS